MVVDIQTVLKQAPVCATRLAPAAGRHRPARAALAASATTFVRMAAGADYGRLAFTQTGLDQAMTIRPRTRPRWRRRK